MTAITDADQERRIQDAAHVLLDLCHAACPAPTDDVPDPALYSSAQVLSVAVQALLMVDHLETGKPLAERGQRRISGKTLHTKFFGLGVGVGQCLEAIIDPVGSMLAGMSFTRGLEAGRESRVGIAKKPRP